MTSLEIYATTTGSPVLLYTPDNIQSLSISKSSNIMPFPIPFIEETTHSDSDVPELIDLVGITGVEANMKISFWAPVAHISTILMMVDNGMNTEHAIYINEWAGIATRYKFYGRIASVDINQSGGTPGRVEASISFVMGKIVKF